MYHAPTVAMHGTIHPLRAGVAGIFQTIRVMRDLVNQYKTNPDIRQSAVSIIYMTPERFELSEVTALFEYVRDHIRYVRDIVGVETVMTPDKTLHARIGDCDDQTLLLAALLESVGYITRFVVSGYSDVRALEHVYLQVLVNGMWISADPTEHEPLGYAPPDPVILYSENV